MMMTSDVLSVSQVNLYIKTLLLGDNNLKHIMVSGEVSNFTNHLASGHYYFSLKDDSATIRCVMFKNSTKNVRFDIEDGVQVLLRGEVAVYEAVGQYQIIVKDMQPLGMGDINLQFMRVKQELSQKGMFDDKYKLKLPEFPLKIGVVTSETGAVIEDIKNVIARRFPLAELILVPASVQGKSAPEEITRSLMFLDNQTSCDVIIIARGGGSAEDLSAFNDIELAYAVFGCKTPTVSAVGHETDFTICDFVADLRAPTPSVAAELITPNVEDLQGNLELMCSRLDDAIFGIVNKLRMKLDYLVSGAAFISPVQRIKQNLKRVSDLDRRLISGYELIYRTNRGVYNTINSKLEALSPERVLKRGYSLLKAQNRLLKSVSNIKTEDKVEVLLQDGSMMCKVLSIYRKEIDEV